LLFNKLPFVGRCEEEIFGQISKGKIQFPACSGFSTTFLLNTLVVD